MRTITASGLSIMFDGDEFDGNDQEQAKKAIEALNEMIQFYGCAACPQICVTRNDEALEVSSETHDDPTVSHAPDCAQRLHTAAECTCFKSR